MHILYIHQHFTPPYGFGNNRSLELSEYWVKAGNKVTLICGSGNFRDQIPFYKLFKTYDINGIKVVRLNVGYSHFHSFPKRVLSFFSFAFLSLILSFRFRKADIVYASSTPLSIGLLGIWYKKVFGRTFVFETVDLWPDVPIEMGILQNKRLIHFLYKIEKWIYSEAELIVCLSEGMKNRIIEKGIKTEKILIGHNGTNCHFFKPSSDKNEAKRKIGYSESDFIILYAGTIGMANGLEFLIDVASHIENSSIKFILLGNGNRKKAIQQYAIQKHTKNVHFIDSVPKNEVTHYFAAADIGAVVFAPFDILNTNSANKFFDYLASGLPVIINYDGWQKEILAKHSCGYSSKNTFEMALQIEYWSQNIKTLELAGQKARETAISLFDRKKIAHNINEIFLHLVSQKKPASSLVERY